MNHEVVGTKRCQHELSIKYAKRRNPCVYLSMKRNAGNNARFQVTMSRQLLNGVFLFGDALHGHFAVCTLICVNFVEGCEL